jgi:predicted peptidase
MHLPLKLTAAAALWTLAACAADQPAASPKPSPVQMPKHLKLTNKQTLEADYLLFLPAGYDAQAEKRWPLVLFLHGSGERGTNLQLVAKHGPPKEVTSHPDFPFILVSPQCLPGEIWSDDVVMALRDEIIHHYRVDTSRVYLTGLSMGGFGTWNTGLRHPEKFAAIAPICGGGDVISLLVSKDEKGEALKSLGVWAFHGAKDPVVPVEESQRMIEACKRMGMKDLKLTIYPEAQHDAWTETYKNPELYQWLLQHQRKTED